MRTRVRLVGLLPLVAMAGVCAVFGCDAEDRAETRTALVVFAASSLTETFDALERGFEGSYPGVDVQPTYAGSQVLRLQIEQGAAAAVYASANERHMQALVEAELVRASHVFAENELVVIVPEGSGIEQFTDLEQASRVVIGTERVPVGAYTREVLDRARAEFGDAFVSRVRAHVVSEESNVRLVRAKVELGEADAAFVYRTDAFWSTKVRVVPIPRSVNVRARYVIGELVRSPDDAGAKAFVAYVRSPAGQAVLRRHGFVAEE